MRKILGVLAASAVFTPSGVLRAQSSNSKNPTFAPVAAETAEVQAVSHPKGLGLGLYVNTLLPTSKPFESQLNGSQEFRYQNATGVGTEITYTINSSMEFGLNAGYEHFSSRAQTGTGTVLEFQKVKYWQVPVLGVLRYKFMNEDISPEIEGGLGYSYGKIDIGSTNLGAKTVSDTLTSYRGHAAAGVGLAWTESSSLHASLGYAMYRFGEKTYTNTLIAVSQANASGVFFKTVMRYKF